MRTVEAVWSWRRDAGVERKQRVVASFAKMAEDRSFQNGDDNASSTGESAEETVPTIACGTPDGFARKGRAAA